MDIPQAKADRSIAPENSYIWRKRRQSCARFLFMIEAKSITLLTDGSGTSVGKHNGPVAFTRDLIAPVRVWRANNCNKLEVLLLRNIRLQQISPLSRILPPSLPPSLSLSLFPFPCLLSNQMYSRSCDKFTRLYRLRAVLIILLLLLIVIIVALDLPDPFVVERLNWYCFGLAYRTKKRGIDRLN